MASYLHTTPLCPKYTRSHEYNLNILTFISCMKFSLLHSFSWMKKKNKESILLTSLFGKWMQTSVWHKHFCHCWRCSLFPSDSLAHSLAVWKSSALFIRPWRAALITQIPGKQHQYFTFKVPVYIYSFSTCFYLSTENQKWSLICFLNTNFLGLIKHEF